MEPGEGQEYGQGKQEIGAEKERKEQGGEGEEEGEENGIKFEPQVAFSFSFSFSFSSCPRWCPSSNSPAWWR